MRENTEIVWNKILSRYYGLEEKDTAQIPKEEKNLFLYFLEQAFTKGGFIYHEDDESSYISKIFNMAWSQTCEYVKEAWKIDIADIINISSLYYEKEEARGNIIFLKEKESDIFIKQIYDVPQSSEQKNQDSAASLISLCHKNNRKIRKMLEVAQEDWSLVFSYHDVRKRWEMTGYTVLGENNVKALVQFQILGHMRWNMFHNGKKILQYNGGEITNSGAIQEKLFKSKLENLSGEYDADRLWKLVKQAMKQRHGTIVVISLEDNETTSKEVKRLTEQSICNQIDINLNETDKNDEFTWIKKLSSIDGALIVDGKGIGYAYAAILDSHKDITVKRDSGRGSRYYSAKKYIASKEKDNYKALAVIISEDGMVNFYSTKDAEDEKDGQEGKSD